jgi:hypothetical protein
MSYNLVKEWSEFMKLVGMACFLSEAAIMLSLILSSLKLDALVSNWLPYYVSTIHHW